MLCAVRNTVFAQERTRFLQCARQRFVNRSIPERRAPRPARQDGRRLSSWIVPHSENEDSLRERDARKHCARDVAGVNVSRVRHKAGSYSSRRRLCIRFGVFVNKSCQFGGIGGVEASSDCGKAKHTAEPRIKQASK